MKRSIRNVSREALFRAGLCSGFLLLLGCMGITPQEETTGLCPQPRSTELASAHIAARKSPLSSGSDVISAGEKLFQSSAAPVACAQCHGKRGDGNGPMARMFNPAPRNFTCTETMSMIPDGQLFWVIKNGSIGTSMPAFNQLSDNEIWQLIIYLRSFSKPRDKFAESESK
jgi:mono/diheme cytochrome c family protein